MPKLVKKAMLGFYNKDTVKLKDQGTMSVKCGTVLQKKFKYYSTDKAKALCVVSNIPLLV